MHQKLPKIPWLDVLGYYPFRILLEVSFTSIYYMSYFSLANPKKLEVELATLKSNNARLTAALQESTANVEEWKRQLEAFKEENIALKSKLLDTETNKGNELNNGELKKEITTLRLKCDSLETELKTKDEKVKDLSTELKDSSSVMENFKCLYEESQENEKTTRLVLSQIDAALNSIRSQIHFS
ncbi:homer protein homolog 2-like [Artemia franciscana]|uniref:homer protein homolog 2-like n=1 Tax=Artemia franciscana TaxID=6661 RepID=UPI0032DBD3DB